MSRVLLKVSGELLAGKRGYGHDPGIISALASDICAVHKSGIQICLVVGGGNIYRGSYGIPNIEKATGDYMGMLGTVINALALQAAIEGLGVQSRVQSAVSMPSVCETYVRRKAVRHMEKGRVVIFAAGTGNPFFTTDTAAVLRAIETGCQKMLKGTLVDGVYSDDPKKNSSAKKIESLSYTEVLSKNLRVLDSSAVSLARDNSLPIIIFALNKKDAFSNVMNNKSSFSVIKGD